MNNRVINEVFARAVKGGDCFRLWVYPGLPHNYEMNPAIAEECGRKPFRLDSEILAAIAARYEADELARLAR